MSEDLVKRLRDWEHVWPDDMDKPAGHLYEDAADRIEELEANLAEQIEWVKRLADNLIAAEGREAKAVVTLSLTRRADDLREAYHRLPNEKCRIGEKRSKKSHARDAWMRAFREAAREARTALAELAGGNNAK